MAIYTLWVAISLLLKKKKKHLTFLSLNLFIFNIFGHVHTTIYLSIFDWAGSL